MFGSTKNIAGREHPLARGRILVTGQMRSGTTMLASFLNSQDDIHLIPDGLRVPTAALNAFGTSVGPSDPLDRPNRARLWAAMKHVALSNPATPQVERDVIEEYQHRDAMPAFSTQAELYLALLDDVAKRSEPFAFHGTKATRGERLALSLGQMGAKAIIILRDPRAVFVSQQARLKRDGTFIASDVERFIEEWRASYAAWRGCGDAALALRYEDFVTGEDEFERISTYLGVPIKPDAEILSVNTTFADKFTGGRRQDPVARWREFGESQAMTFIENGLSDEMNTVGYA